MKNSSPPRPGTDTRLHSISIKGAERTLDLGADDGGESRYLAFSGRWTRDAHSRAWTKVIGLRGGAPAWNGTVPADHRHTTPHTQDSSHSPESCELWPFNLIQRKIWEVNITRIKVSIYFFFNLLFTTHEIINYWFSQRWSFSSPVPTLLRINSR